MIHYIKGDATNPQAKGPKLIAHVCNDIGKMGAGFALAISKRFPEVRESFLSNYKFRYWSKLGDVQFIQDLGPGQTVTVANMIAQHGIKTGSHGPPIRYDVLEKCLTKVAYEAHHIGASVHMPRIGCGLAGGRWEEVEPLITNALQGVEVYVYDYEGKS